MFKCSYCYATCRSLPPVTEHDYCYQFPPSNSHRKHNWEVIEELPNPIPMLLWCPGVKEYGQICGHRHIDRGEFATKPHHTHACQSCGMVWRPAILETCGVEFLPGFKDEN